MNRTEAIEVLNKISRKYFGSSGFNEHINVGKWYISVQYGPYHYSSPRINLEYATDYDSVEVAIFYGAPINEEGCQKFLNPEGNPIFNKAEPGGETLVFPFVPIDSVIELLIWCSENEYKS